MNEQTPQGPLAMSSRNPGPATDLWQTQLDMGGQPQNHPAGRALDLGRRAEGSGVRQAIDEVRRRRAGDRDLVVADGGDGGERGGEIGD